MNVLLRPDRTPGRGASVFGATDGPLSVGLLRGKGLPSRFNAMPPRLAAIPKQADAIYLSQEWRSFVDAIKNERGWKCVQCGPVAKGVRLLGDHVHEIKDGGAVFDPRNVQLLCLPCHNTKTARERERRTLTVGA
jgi:5-methylcytosine-specific restriction endonuclease McrA